MTRDKVDATVTTMNDGRRTTNDERLTTNDERRRSGHGVTTSDPALAAGTGTVAVDCRDFTGLDDDIRGEVLQHDDKRGCVVKGCGVIMEVT